ncbi:MAG: hypothetical protein RIT04_347 [Candidatus Parcubacteria bacterium]|jgi:valyl-tRNA synthetase
MNEKFLKPYNSAEAEERISKLWDESGFFNPDNLPTNTGALDSDGQPRFSKPFSIILPPPNVTGTLHAGHAMMLAVQDIIIRFERMRGKKTLWLPGTDHAAIATQSKVEGIIYKEEGKRRHDLGREELLKRVEQFAQNSHDTIVSQVKAMGSSVDWSREAFTLDEIRNKAVRTAFKQMYDDGIIYRGYRIVNWDVKGQTTISDDEIVYVEQKSKLYTFRYGKTETGEPFPIPIASGRPETKVGDVAVAVHPDDARYKQYIGKEYKVNFAGTQLTIKVVGDEAAQPEFGTGAVGVTPCHSMTDWDIAERHGLRKDLIVINEVGKMTEAAGPMVAGKKIAEARTTIVEWLKSEGLLEKEEDIVQNVTTAERTGGVIEPLPKLQWFVSATKRFTQKFGPNAGKETSLKELMLGAVRANGGEIEIIPDRFEKTYLHWIENLRDWCISRQIWYGHRIPVWYRTDASGKEEVFVGVEAPQNSADGVGAWKQDEDTLDTWFSSGLWTFSTLGWPDAWDPQANGGKGGARPGTDLALYHPTDILETGRDIIFFWVARMILMSTYLIGEIPFKTVYLHGLVLDGAGKKMSKSLGNVIDPLAMKEKYGADAFRLSLIIGTGPGNDSRISDDKIKGYRNFANKLWNIARFILSNTTGESETNKPSAGILIPPAIDYDPAFSAFSDADSKLIEELDALIVEITKEMEEYKFYIVAEKLYHYAWDKLAADILEDSKKIFAAGDAAAIRSRQQFLLRALDRLLRVLHPFIPFVTEEIWSHIPKSKNRTVGLLMISEWPE